MANGFHSGRQRLCRLCVSDQYELYPISGGGIADLAEKIFDCTSVVINNDALAMICQQCRSRIVISHHFVAKCQTADRKYHRMFGPQLWKPNQLSVGDFNSKPVTQDVERAGNNGRLLAYPPKVPIQMIANGAIPAKHPVLQRLKYDDIPLRRHSIDHVRKVKTKPEAKRRLSEESHISSASIKLMAAEIEQALTNDLDRKMVTGRQKCPKCGHLVFNLRRHLLLHSTISKFICEVCNKSYSKACTLQYHMNLHSGEKPYRCRSCGKAFSSPSKVWIHRQNNKDCNSGYRASKSHLYNCNGCQSVFMHRTLIDEHMRSQHPEREHSCETCGKGYVNRWQLIKHRNGVHGPAK